jgi:hypothetical protein
MKDYGNDPNWQIDANGHKYARKLPTQPDERFYLYGPGSGHRRTDRVFDGLITAVVVGFCVAATVALLGVLRSGDTQPVKSDVRTTVCK